MQPVIYLDTYMLINFCMDFLSLYITGRIMRAEIKALRLMLAAVIGAGYSALSVITGEAIIPSLIIHLAVSVLMCLTAFKIKKTVEFIKLFSVFYLVCFVLGGGIQALYYLATTYAGAASGIPTGFIFSLALICGSLSIFAGNLVRRRVQNPTAQLTITLHGKSVSIKALVDSGNIAEDPLSGLPVLIAGFDCLSPLFDDNEIDFFSNTSLRSASTLSTLTASKIKLRLIPIKTVSGSEILPAFVPDSIKLCGSKSDEKRAVIAVQSKSEIGGGCEAILPAVLL